MDRTTGQVVRRIEMTAAGQEIQIDVKQLGVIPRELEVLREMAQGRTNPAIGASLHLSESAVEKYVSSIFSKLGLTEESRLHRGSARSSPSFATKQSSASRSQGQWLTPCVAGHRRQFSNRSRENGRGVSVAARVGVRWNSDQAPLTPQVAGGAGSEIDGRLRADQSGLLAT